jgi:hypothetical protein
MARVTGVDIFTSQTGLEAVNINNSTILTSKLPPPGSSNGSSQNSGAYCEESWCVPDEVQMVGGAQFKNDTNDLALKGRIVDFFTNRRTRGGGAQYERTLQAYSAKVDEMCRKASANNISCALLAALWLQESSGSLEDNVALGCFGESIPEFKATWRTFSTQVDCAIGSLKSSQAKYAAGIELSGPGSEYTPNWDGSRATVDDPVKVGQCKPATLFSMAMQRYTPTDRRINFNNQCNKGLIVRDDQGQCISDAKVGGASDDNVQFDSSRTTAKWPSGSVVKTRPNLQFAMQQFDPRLKADNTFCFPSDNNSGNGTSTNDPNIDAVKKAYGLTGSGENQTNEYTVKTGIFKMDWGKWTTSWAAGNVAMALDGGINNKGVEGNRGIAGAHIIKPGSSFVFNEIIGNPTDAEVVAKYPDYRAKGYTFDNPTIIGGGWCELATTVGEAAFNVQYRQNSSSPQQYLPTRAKAGGPHGSGITGNIDFWWHGLGLNDFVNDNIGVDGYALKDPQHFVSILTSGSSSTSDNDLTITNPYSAESGVDMVVAVSVDSRKVITVEVFFGKNGSGSSTPTPTSNSGSLFIPPFVYRKSA